MTLAKALAENTALKTENAALRENLQTLQFQLDQLKRLVFGQKRERLVIPTEQPSLPFDALAAPLAEAVPIPAHHRARPRREALPEHLPREIEVLDLPEKAKPCPGCGGQRHVIGEVVTEKLDYVPASLKVLQNPPAEVCLPGLRGGGGCGGAAARAHRAGDSRAGAAGPRRGGQVRGPPAPASSSRHLSPRGHGAAPRHTL